MKQLVNIIGSSLGAVALFAGVASAASLGMTSTGLATGNATGINCTPSSSLTATRSVDNSGDVTEVDVLGVPQACAGETVYVTLRDAAKASLGQASAAVGACTGGCTVTLTGWSAISAANVAGYSIAITG